MFGCVDVGYFDILLFFPFTKKIKKSKPGNVTYTNNKTIDVIVEKIN